MQIGTAVQDGKDVRWGQSWKECRLLFHDWCPSARSCTAASILTIFYCYQTYDWLPRITILSPTTIMIDNNSAILPFYAVQVYHPSWSIPTCTLMIGLHFFYEATIIDAWCYTQFMCDYHNHTIHALHGKRSPWCITIYTDCIIQ